MSIINQPASLPGLGRLIINQIISSGNTEDREMMLNHLLPDNLRSGGDPTNKFEDTLTAIRDAGLVSLSGSTVSTTPVVNDHSQGRPLTPEQFRRLLQRSIFEVNYEDPWDYSPGVTLTGGAKDLNRALSWFLAQDARSTLAWDSNSTGIRSVQTLQSSQIPEPEVLRPFSNSNRWLPFTRWSVAIGMAEPALTGNGLHANATVAIRDITLEMSRTLYRVDDYLDELAKRLPVLSGGTTHRGFLQHTDCDPDPHASVGAIDTTIGQALLALEEDGLLVLRSESDTDRRTINLGADLLSVTHVDVREVGAK